MSPYLYRGRREERGEGNIKYTPLLRAIIINILALCILSQCHIEGLIGGLTVIFLVTTTQLAFLSLLYIV